MTTRSCPYCNKSVNESDSRCPACGKRLLFYKLASDANTAKSTLGQPKPVDVRRVEPTAASRSAKRQSVRPLLRFLPILVIGGLAAFGAISAHFAAQDKVIPETQSSPGYSIVRDLQKRGEIDSFAAVEPKKGWDSEYSLDGGAAHLLFRGANEASFRLSDSAPSGLEDAVNAALARAGYQ